jgi:hypothetical protein
MKNIILLILAFQISISNAQVSFVVRNITKGGYVSPNQTVYLTTKAGATRDCEFDIKNKSNSNKTYLVKIFKIQVNSGATARFCFGGSCPPDTTFISPSSLLLNPNDSASNQAGSPWLISDLDEGPSVGFSKVKYTFFNANLPSDSIQFTIEYNGTVPTGLESQSENTINVYPNPNTGNFYVEASENSNIKILNVDGKIIS